MAEQAYLYAFELSSGVVKLGCSIAPHIRYRAGANYFARSWGRKPYARIVRAACFPMRAEGRGAHRVEQAMLDRARALGTAVRPFREFFVGLDFGAAANLALQFSGRN